MKKIFQAASSLLILASCAGSAGTQDMTPADALISRLYTQVEAGKIMYGHQDDLMYGHSWKLEDAASEFVKSDIHGVCGKYPAVYGMDLGGIEVGWEANLDKNDFDNMRASAVAHHERGGVVTFSWHPRNPLTGGDAWDVSSKEVVASILPGGEKHEFFMGWLSNAADFLGSIRTAEGQAVPVVWRPWHEHTGSWFWWGQDLCTTEQYKALWQMTYDYMVKERGLDNLVWAYSPGAGGITPELFAERYPGDEVYIKEMKHALGVMSAFNEGRGKIMAVTETGYEGIPNASWWTDVLYQAVKDYPVSYVLTWRNACDDHMQHHFYGPYPGHLSAENFKEFAELEKIELL